MSKPERLAVLKTYKLFIGGKFVRTESGRYLESRSPSGELLANYCWGSRKDVRDAVRVARGAQAGWGDYSAYLRGQILYRAAEMLEDRADSLAADIERATGQSKKKASREVAEAVDRFVYYAGWSDKYSALFGSVNPVSSPHFNFTVPEPTGVVGILCPNSPSLLGMVSLIGAAVVSGNSVVVIASEDTPLPGATLAEIIATSDFPGGVINLITGKHEELAPVLASHQDVNAFVVAEAGEALRTTIDNEAAANLKRVTFPELSEEEWFGDAGRDPYQILSTVEMKTTWHPVGV